MCVVTVQRIPSRPPEAHVIVPRDNEGVELTDVLYMEIDGADAWLVAQSETPRARTINLHLMRLHIERVAFESVARALAYNSQRDSEYTFRLDDPAVQDTVAACVQYLSKSVAYGRDQAGLLDALEFDLTLHAAEWDALRDRLKLLPEKSQVQITQILEQVIGDKVMGDKFQNIKGSTIVNRSAVVDSFNQLAANDEEELVEALRDLAETVERTGNTQATDLTEGLIKEFAGARNPTMLQTLWNGIKSAAPVVASLSSVIGVLSKFVVV
jgi:hypothetical protein